MTYCCLLVMEEKASLAPYVRLRAVVFSIPDDSCKKVSSFYIVKK